ncbi:MAG: SGNH/GDSL hydrolase family protein [Isosphaeraceae bacterium]
MTKTLAGLLLALSLLLTSPAQAVKFSEITDGGSFAPSTDKILTLRNGNTDRVAAFPTVDVAHGGTGATTAAAARANLGIGSATAAGRQPVCIRGNLPSDLGTTSGSSPQIRGRNVYFCPQGAKYISLMYAGVWANQTVETDLADPIPLSIGIETVAGTAGGTLSTAPVPVTCNGQRPCLLPTRINTSGNTVTQGFLVTDPIPVNVPVGGYIAVRTYVGQSSGQKVAWGIYNSYQLGESCTALSSISDNSLTTSVPSAFHSACLTPTGILGVPQVPVTSACIIGDSIGSGYVTLGLTSVGLSSGGSAYAQSDVGKILTVPGGTTLGTAYPAQVIITQVNGGSGTGAVTGVALYTQGSYAVGGTPTSPQSPTGSTTGSGLAITFNTGGAYDTGDAYGDKGYLQRALGPTTPFVAFTRGSDSLQGWANRDYARMAMIAASGCKNAIIELGVNDRSAGAATMESNLQKLTNQLLSLGVNVYATTLTPVTSSTDGFATTANQTPDAYVSTLATYNTDLAANYASWGLSGVFDVSAAVSSSPGSGLWAANGTIGYETIDGVHLEGAGITNAATAVNVNLLK